MSSIEQGISNFTELSFGQRKAERNGLCTEVQLNEILKAENPCLVVIKPHAADSEDVGPVLDTIVSGFGLKTLVKKRMEISKDNVFGLYGDLLEVMQQGEAGVEFVNGLTASFVDGGEAIVYIVSGPDSYQKIKVTKKFLRDMGTEDRFRNVMHSSDDLQEAIREINALLIK